MRNLPSASILENVRFNRTVILPNALQGLFKRRPVAVKAATAIDVDGDGARLLTELRNKHGGLPVWVRVVTDPALVVLDVHDARRVLEGSPDPFAADPPAKRKGIAHFQPEALTISRGELWKQRREFADEVLGNAPRERFAELAHEELSGLGSPFDFETLHLGFRRLTRRMVLGDAAREDEALSEQLAELMSEANGLPEEPSDAYPAFAARMEDYVGAEQEGSLAGVAAAVEAPSDVRKAGQFIHWLFATQDTLALNVMRALALLAVEDTDDLPGTLQEAMRLWPTTPMLTRETLKPLAWHQIEVPEGTQVLIVNTFFHRDEQRLGGAANRFTPERWGTDGLFTKDWGLNHFSHGPQGCPGAGLAVHVGVAALEAILEQGRPRIESGGGKLKARERVPNMLDPFALRLSFG